MSSPDVKVKKLHIRGTKIFYYFTIIIVCREDRISPVTKQLDGCYYAISISCCQASGPQVSDMV